MAAEEGLLLNVSSLPAPGFARRRRASQAPRGPGTQQRKALKRKFQWPEEGTQPKQKARLSSPQAKKLATGPLRPIKGLGPPKSPPKKSLTECKVSNASSRTSVKTSSLFRNNPEIPDVQRPSVEQVQERVFTSDSFDQLGLHPHLTSTITSVLGMSCMTSVQKQTIPVLMQGKDALVRSQTGSGKTLAYGIPLIQSLQNMEPKIKRSDGLYAVILVPTRELALQSFQTIQKLLKPFTWIVPGVLMGGEKKKSEKARLRKGINILIATPGRLVDHIKSTQCLHFHQVQWLILDEADRILDQGFEKAVTAILNAVNTNSEKRQNVLLSATLTDGVARLADISLHDPVCISVVEEVGGSSSPKARACLSQADRALPASAERDTFAVPEKLQQNITVVPSKLRLVTLAAFILGKCKFEKCNKMMIFFSSCEQVEFHHTLFQTVLAEGLETGGLEPSLLPPLPLVFQRLHGDMKQEERTTIFQDFLQSKTGVLLCTDVAARGLDLPEVTWIVQYNPPASLAEYVHRIGRTARIGSQGNSLLILAPSEAEYVNLLASHKINVSELKMESILSCLVKDNRFVGNRGGNKKFHSTDPQEVRRRATVLQTQFENFVHSNMETVQQAKKALQSFIRSYATYPASLKHIFHVRLLHLGHVAKSFGLRDAPKNLSTRAVPKKRKNQRQKRPDLLRKNWGHRRLAEVLRSEYSSGLDSGTSQVKRKKGPSNLGNPKPLR
ncbi:probable ATP-dependent RNA helicase DDX31 [Eublepharis macularius]|uniref:ATP-dependent RNA helicase n=1 Tax=Eublepharis macularius TaxID=481883 RepID=A0AA97KCG6_EUBMA|nr:probable ATP-dependent RNA helicase DDX31 [Eublepharis macularius]